MLCQTCLAEMDLVGQSPAYCVWICDNNSCPKKDKAFISANLEYGTRLFGRDLKER
jgi:hypothetical protein